MIALNTKRLRVYTASQAAMEELIDIQTDDELKAAYQEMLDGYRMHPEQWQWYVVWIIEQKDGTYVGDICFKGLCPDGSTEIGYGLLDAYQGIGYATEAVSAAVHWALQQPGVSSVVAETEPNNRASQRVLEKVGFRPTGQMGEEGPRFSIQPQALCRII